MARKEKYKDFKKRIGKKCQECGELLCPGNSSGFCRSCSMRLAVSRRLSNNQIKKRKKVVEKLKRGYHKFEDIELMDLWERGHSDGFIANILGVSTSVVCQRRYKLGLVANYKPFFGENLDEEQMVEREEERQEELKELRERYYENPTYFNKKRYKNYVKNHGRKKINEKFRENYEERKRKSKLRCMECNKLVSPKNKKGLCNSCCQKKFSDKEFYNLYKQGMNDYQIARILNVHPSAICKRKKRLNIIGNFNLKRRSVIKNALPIEIKI